MSYSLFELENEASKKNLKTPSGHHFNINFHLPEKLVNTDFDTAAILYSQSK